MNETLLILILFSEIFFMGFDLNTKIKNKSFKLKLNIFIQIYVKLLLKNLNPVLHEIFLLQTKKKIRL